MNARALMKGSLISLLNRALDRQGMADVRVVDLSADYKIARVSHTGKSGRKMIGAVRSEIVLSPVAVSS